MDRLINVSIERPMAVIAAVLMVIMFGFVALETIPIQLTPDVNRPVITVTTQWPGAAPAEVEREVVNRQEKELKGIEGLESIVSRSETGRARVTLEFSVGQDMTKAVLLVSNRLDRVGNYPAEVNEPSLNTAGSEDNAIAWLILRKLEGNETEVHKYYDLANDFIKDRLERVKGISEVRVYGGAEREMQIIVNPESLARYKLTIPDILNTLRMANASISAGAVDEGKRRYVVRTEGDFESIRSVKNVVLKSTKDITSGRITRVKVEDIADVIFDYKKPVSRIRMMGEPAIALPVYRETGANVIEVMRGIRSAVKDINRNFLATEKLVLTQVYDETTYIDSAINLVQQNIYIGGTLAAIVLLLFLRSGSATLVISLAIPVSIVGSFVAMAVLGRSINVISLAGLAFAIGMVVDAAIVVLENIFRFRQQGLPITRAAFEGANQVWGAVLVSALTTVMAFIPILIMELEVGQLFRDIAVAISVAVLLSLIVSVTVIPALASRLLKGNVQEITTKRRINFIDHSASMFVRYVLNFTRAVTSNRVMAASAVISVLLVSGVITTLLLPKLDYLPDGNRNLIIGYVMPPSGYNLKTMTEIATKSEKATEPLWDIEEKDKKISVDQPSIQRFFFAAFRANAIIGAVATDPSRIDDLIPILERSLYSEPKTFAIMRKRSIFGRGIGGSRSIDLDVSGGNLEEIIAIAQRAAGKLGKILPRREGTRMRPRPSLSLGAPEIRVKPNPTFIADNKLSSRGLGLTLDAFNDGLRVAEITVEGERLDLTIKGPTDHIRSTQSIEDLPIATTDGRIIPTSSLADIEITRGPSEIRHKEQLRTITLQINPPTTMALETAMEKIQLFVINELRNEGVPNTVKLELSGTADKLTETWDEMVLDLLIALVIVYLVMAVLFESFLYPLIIIFSVPLAAAGGVIGLVILSLFQHQNLDMLTLLGFVILVGIVVNNAILLVHQTLHQFRSEGLSETDAIIEATRNRIRPIFMSTLTSVLGMMPLVLFPGAGAELYRGLGSVVIGGLTLSAVLTLIIIPSLLSIFMVPIEKYNKKQQMI
ncbi:MAG: acriflavin resistance protein [Rhodospirillaceae bacterium]|nr:acriflavin resistance protein [Rhodospirillaceae bacterium]OUU23125.1 MAG: acriflavin resistance protein [Candidatus Endolissoclinum sp. TMED37]